MIGDRVWITPVHGFTNLCTYPDVFFPHTFVLFQSGKDPRMLCSMRMRLCAQCLHVRRSVPWPGPPTTTRQKRSTATEVPNPSMLLGARGYPHPENLIIDDPLHLPHQQPATANTKPHGQP